MIQTREEFKQWISQNWSDISTESDSPLWIPEHDLDSTLCKWFVTVKPLRISKSAKSKISYWNWCKKNLTGRVRCFYSDTDGERECWGFTQYEDISWWMLKYAK